MGARTLPQPDPLTGVVAALPAEARTAQALQRIGWRVRVAGPGPDRARAAAEALLDAGVERLLVWGTAGGLQPDLRPGALVVASEVMDAEGTRFPVFGQWQQQLLASAASGVKPSTGALVSLARPVTDRRAKAALAAQTGAVAVDMETVAIARLALARGLPFALLRAIVDPLEQALPSAVSAARPGPHFALRVALRLAARPRDWPRVVALEQNMRAAKASLAAAARRLAATAA